MTRIARYVTDPECKRLLLEKERNKEGENGSIGTVATRGPIIDKLVERGYFREENKKLISTPLGRELYRILPDELKKPDMTARMKTAELLHKYVPSVETIGGYAHIDNFYDKTEEQLRNMAAVGYANPYIGVESGDDVVLKQINKGYTAAQAREQLEKIDASGLLFIVNFLNEAGGHGYRSTKQIANNAL